MATVRRVRGRDDTAKDECQTLVGSEYILFPELAPVASSGLRCFAFWTFGSLALSRGN